MALDYPLFPSFSQIVWELTVQANVKADTKGGMLAIAVPGNNSSHTIYDEHITSGTLDFSLTRQSLNRIATWATPSATAEDTIDYSVKILVGKQGREKVEPLIGVYPTGVSKAEQAVAEDIVARWSGLAPSAKLREILKSKEHMWQPLHETESIRETWRKIKEVSGPTKALLILFRAAELPARRVEGFSLVEGVYTTPITWVQVWTGRNWENVRIATGEVYGAAESLLGIAYNRPMFQALSGSVQALQWTLVRQRIQSWSLYFERVSQSRDWLSQWSLFHLPEEFQNTFRILLLIPISALLIGFLRNVVGFPTFGIFMPVLMALAFRNTGLVVGLSIFIVVIAIGYFFRSVLNSLRLLLVPRLSVILSLVITFLTVLALIGNKYGLRQFMAVGLLPIVILTMTIERFFVTSEEAGVRVAVRTALGSAVVASITFWIIHWESLQITFFVFPEFILAVAALQILLGRYTGYRLSEFSRFLAFRRNKP